MKKRTPLRSRRKQSIDTAELNEGLPQNAFNLLNFTTSILLNFSKLVYSIISTVSWHTINLMKQGVEYIWKSRFGELNRVSKNESTTRKIKKQNLKRAFDSGSVSSSNSFDILTYAEEQDFDSDLDSTEKLDAKITEELKYIQSCLKNIFTVLLIPVGILLAPIYFCFPVGLLLSIHSLCKHIGKRLKRQIIEQLDFFTGKIWFEEQARLCFYMVDEEELQVLSIRQTRTALSYLYRDLNKSLNFFSCKLPTKREVTRVFRKVDRLGEGFITEEEFLKIARYLCRDIGFTVGKQFLYFCVGIPFLVICTNIIILNFLPLGDMLAMLFCTIYTLVCITVASSVLKSK